MSGTQETPLTLARELSGAGEAEEALLELLCQAAEQQWGEAAAAGNDDGGLRQGVPLRRGLHRRRGPGGGAGR